MTTVAVICWALKDVCDLAFTSAQACYGISIITPFYGLRNELKGPGYLSKATQQIVEPGVWTKAGAPNPQPQAWLLRCPRDIPWSSTQTDTPVSLGKTCLASDRRLFPFPCLIAAAEYLEDFFYFIELEVMYHPSHPFNCVIQWSLVYSQIGAAIMTVSFRTFSSPQEETLSFNCHPHLPPPFPSSPRQPLCYSLTIYISLFWTFMWIRSCSMWSFVTSFSHSA